ncbi:hypothetical protein Ldum_1430 [Fluoribacter dumoffii NY 23]|nr:hypothetical protein Ldum_1430 [Fluoribacter dumoffii NY 23]
MEKVSIRSYKKISPILLSFALLIGFFYSNLVKASTTTQLPGQQFAYFVGYHSGYYGPATYHHHHYHRGVYWTPWRYIGHGCRKSCLIDRWSGRVIRCKTRCRY